VKIKRHILVLSLVAVGAMGIPFTVYESSQHAAYAQSRAEIKQCQITCYNRFIRQMERCFTNALNCREKKRENYLKCTNNCLKPKR